MITSLKESLWKQFGASIDMLSNSITLWPDDNWYNNKKVFYIAYHSAVFLDYYLTIPSKNFTSPLPFTLVESDNIPEDAIDDVIPDRIYTKRELLDYLQSSRKKCHRIIGGLTEEKLNERWIEDPGNMNYSFLEILLYNMRHVQHHAAQLNLLLRKEINIAPWWISRAHDDL
jgi:hypothetical protein